MMLEPYFTIPADYKLSTISDYAQLNTNLAHYKIREVYGSLKSSAFGTGRPPIVIPDCSDETFREYVKTASQLGIAFNYTFNANCLGAADLTKAGLNKIYHYIGYLHDCGVRRMTIAIPTLIDFVNKYFPDIDIYLSIVYGLDSVEKLKWLTEDRCIKSVYIHECLHRRLPELGKLCMFCNENNIEAAILVNSFCDVNCPFRSYHYSMTAHAHGATELPFLWYYGTECNLRRLKDPRKALNIPWIRPDDMEIYTKIGVTRFKYAGRDLFPFGADFKKAVSIYNDRSYQGNLMELLMAFAKVERADLYCLNNTPELGAWLKRVFDGELHCDQCDNCGACSHLLEHVYPSKEIFQKYLKMYEDRRAMARTLLEQ